MTRAEIEERVKAFLVDDLEIEEENIYPESRLKEDMGVDSLDYVDIVVIVEQNFGFNVTGEDFAKSRTFQDFYNLVIERTTK